MCSNGVVTWDAHTITPKMTTEREHRTAFAELLKSHASAATLSEAQLVTELERRGQHDAAAVLHYRSTADLTWTELNTQMEFDIHSTARARFREWSLSMHKEALGENLLRNVDKMESLAATSGCDDGRIKEALVTLKPLIELLVNEKVPKM
jgi:hypothetical protein